MKTLGTLLVLLVLFFVLAYLVLAIIDPNAANDFVNVVTGHRKP